nr:TPA_asm: hypothetical protein HUJ06_010155 [Nelumbo nucifera]
MLEMEYLSMSHLLNDGNPLDDLPMQFQTTENNNHEVDKLFSGDMAHQFPSTAKFQVNQSTVFNPPIFINPLFEFQ